MANRKLMWVSNAPWTPSGYGQQTALFVPKLAELGYDVAITAFFGLEAGMGQWHGLPVYPTDHTRLAKHRLPEYVKHFAGKSGFEDVQVITLMDAWTWVSGQFGDVANWNNLNIAAWAPVDHNPCPPAVIKALKTFDARPIAMSRFGLEQFQAHAATETGSDLRPLYVPHGVDTEAFQPRDREAFRREHKIPDDAFLVGMVANNQGDSPPRKAFPQMMQAFAIFAMNHPDAYLYVHSDVFGFYQGVNLLYLASLAGVPPDRIAAVDQLAYHLGTIPGGQMSYVYSAMDVLACPSYGEGFGIPIVEAQACGTPVIVTNWTSMPELVGAGWTIEGDRWYDAGAGSFWKNPDVFELVGALEKAYQARGDRELRAAARSFGLAYDADLVVEECWKPTMAALEADFEGAAEPEPKPNRAQRRKKQKTGAAA